MQLNFDSQINQALTDMTATQANGQPDLNANAKGQMEMNAVMQQFTALTDALKNVNDMCMAAINNSKSNF